jgi:predicted enzyme related to lactoylglutathione lyase
MKIKYIPIFTEDIETQARFFTDNLGFEICSKKNILLAEECIVIKTNTQDVFIVIARDAGFDYRKCHIVVNTEDCLSDYHSLKKSGVFFYNEPHYSTMGLGAEFMDPSGNRCLLIEERSYNNLI